MNGKRKWIVGLAAGGALLLNMLLIQAISSMNLTAAERGPELAATIDMTRVQLAEIVEPDLVDEEAPPAEEPPTRVELDMPVPTMTLDAIGFEDPLLELQLPSISPSAVNVVVRQSGTPLSDVRDVARQGPAVRARADTVDSPPRELSSNRQPRYPRSALRRSEEGLVKLDLLIDEDGAVVEVKVLEGEPAFTKAVLEVVHGWRFTPPRHAGQPLSVWGLKTFRFSLPNR